MNEMLATITTTTNQLFSINKKNKRISDLTKRLDKKDQKREKEKKVLGPNRELNPGPLAIKETYFFHSVFISVSHGFRFKPVI